MKIVDFKYPQHPQRAHSFDFSSMHVTERRSFNVYDKKNRIIGAVAYTGTATVNDDVSANEWSRGVGIAPGVYFIFSPQATRDGHGFGASQGRQWFSTEESRAAAITKYFTNAAKRAAKLEDK